jgi:hypothetical protein
MIIQEEASRVEINIQDNGDGKPRILIHYIDLEKDDPDFVIDCESYVVNDDFGEFCSAEDLERRAK